MSFDDLTLQSYTLGFHKKETLSDQVQKLYDENHESCYRFLMMSGCSADEALELLQEAFLRLSQALSEGTSLERQRSWLIRVLQRLR
jgi:DNA-directed RNA polymerase specialized sigma24 family protein